MEYYVLGHISKFVLPGAYRIDSNAFGSESIEDVAFRNPDGSKVLIVLNSVSSSKTFTVYWSSKSFIYTLPAGVVANFTRAGTPSAQTARSP